jgi:hypothetical protein
MPIQRFMLFSFIDYQPVIRPKQPLRKHKGLSNSSENIVVVVDTKALKINDTNFANERKIHSVPLLLVLNFHVLQVKQ